MAYLNRSLAPVPEKAWEFIDGEAKKILELKLIGRKIVDFIGPRGLEFAGVNTGRRRLLEVNAPDGVVFYQRETLPLLELEIPFTLKKQEIEALTRGAEDIDIDPLIEAADKLSDVENKAIFYGIEGLFTGIMEKSDNKIEVMDDGLVPAVGEGVNKLIEEGVSGPYVLLLGREKNSALFKVNDRGYPLKRRLEEIMGGKVLPAPELKDAGLLLSRRGGDFEFFSGQDIAIGFKRQIEGELEFYFIESFAFRVNTPEAAVILK